MKLAGRVAALILVAALCGFAAACKKDRGNGLLGIVVPVGEGRATKDAPCVISGVYEGSPAHNAGILPGDQILQVNGADVEGLQYDDIYHNHLLGPPGSRVAILIRRGKESKLFELTRGD